MNSEDGPNIEDIIDEIGNAIVLEFPYGFEKADEIIYREVNKDKSIGGCALIYSVKRQPRYKTRNEHIIGWLITKYFVYKASVKGGLLDDLDPEVISNLEKERKVSEEGIKKVKDKMDRISEVLDILPEKRIENKVKRYKDWKSAVNSLDEVEILTLAKHMYERTSEVYDEMGLKDQSKFNEESPHE